MTWQAHITNKKKNSSYARVADMLWNSYQHMFAFESQLIARPKKKK